MYDSIGGDGWTDGELGGPPICRGALLRMRGSPAVMSESISRYLVSRLEARSSPYKSPTRKPDLSFSLPESRKGTATGYRMNNVP